MVQKSHSTSKKKMSGAPAPKVKQEEEVTSVVEVLNGLLANEYSLFTKTLNFHWNVTGKRFHALHTFLGAEYRELLELMDEVAERVRILGYRPLSTVSEMLSVTTLHESPGRVPTADKMLGELLVDHLAIQKYLKAAVTTEELFADDPSTQDFLIKILQKHEKTGWMLRSHIIDEGLN